MNCYLLGFTSSAGAKKLFYVYANSSELAERKAREAKGNGLLNFRLSWWEIATNPAKEYIAIIQ